ncbi:hypothetical protein [Porphyromonas gingivalis]|nr:hypothetical protein [Porphyromonas gingivalis]
MKKSRLRTKRFSHHFWGILVSDLGDFRFVTCTEKS